MALFADIIVDRHHQNVDNVFTYRVPEALREALVPGMMVEVPFGKGDETLKGYCLRLSDVCAYPEDRVKEIIGLLGTEPAFSEENIELAGFMKRRWGATLSSCLALFVPKKPGTKLKKGDEAAPRKAYTGPLPTLNREQQNAFDRVGKALDRQENKPFLLHGITGSGKTEIYMRLAQKVIDRGRTVILLVPEISLTPQLIHVLSERFGEERIGVFHSGLTDVERSRRWEKARLGYYDIVTGARSALFAPLSDVGLIILDEEHESSYQSDQMPHYHAREVACEMCRLKKIPLLLGSATPAVETYYRAEQGEIELLELTKRATGAVLPEMHAVDLCREMESGNTGIFSLELARELKANFERGEQSLLFLNRRGYASFVNCRACGFALRCPACYLPYTYHKEKNQLICHHCGKTVAMPAVCPSCGSPYIRTFGLGTQRVEEEARKLLPDARIERMDLNAAAKKGTYEALYERMVNHDIDVLVGTQMIAKGFDFPDVTLVGIVSADMCLYDDDYHSAERTFALLSQAAGRAGRKDKPGRVVLQSFAGQHYAVSNALKQDYKSFYKEEIASRRLMRVPPFSHLMQVVVTGANEDAVRQDVANFYACLKAYGQNKPFVLLGPAPASIARLDNKFRWKIMIKNDDAERLISYADYCLDRFLNDKRWQATARTVVSLTLDPDQLQ